MTKPFDPTKPVKTRSGWPARIVDTNFKSNPHEAARILAVLTQEDGKETIRSYYASGQICRNGDESPYDLVNIPETRTAKVKRWVVLYNTGQIVTFDFDPAEFDPNMYSRTKGRIFAVREVDLDITFTEGEGLAP